MINLTSTRLRLRALEADDLTYFMAVENDSTLWNVCDTRVPFSRHTLQRILEATVPDIYAEKQLRLVVCVIDDERPVGFVDLYDFSPLHRRCGVGVIIYPATEREKGYAAEALRLALGYAFEAYDLHQVWADVAVDNEASLRLFESLGMKTCYIKKDWIKEGDKYKDVCVYHVLRDDFMGKK